MRETRPPPGTPGVWVTLPVVVAMCAAPLVAGCKEKKGVCGNGVTERDNGEQCDCGNDPADLPSTCIDVNGGLRSNCTADCIAQNVAYTELVIHWTINGEWTGAGGGSFDTCGDIGSSEAHLVTYGPSGWVDERHVDCAAYQLTYMESQQLPLFPGTYTVSATMMDSWGAVTDSRMGQGLVQVGWVTNLTVDFPLESIPGHESLTGDLTVRFTWTGAQCGDASPVVETENLDLSADASPLAGFPRQRPCEYTFWILEDLPIGDYLMRAEGIPDATDVPSFCHDFPVKVGIGGNKPYLLDVPYTGDGSCMPP